MQGRALAHSAVLIVRLSESAKEAVAVHCVPALRPTYNVPALRQIYSEQLQENIFETE